MSAGAWMMVLATVLAIGSLGVVIFSLVRSIMIERTRGRSVWREFGLGLALMIIFFASWIGHGIAQWQSFTDEERQFGEEPQLGDFMSNFAEATLENWQSEFLQLFAFVALSALFIHKGSAESKDGDEKVQASLRRIEEHLGTLPPDAPSGPGESWQLPDTPMDMEAEAR
jgi:hypothetical protein